MMKPNPFGNHRADLLHYLLTPPSMLFSAAVRSRIFLYRHRILPSYSLARPVISVGNLTTGGTGKTPMTDHLASVLSSRGLQVSILSRGYRGQSKERYLVVCRGNGPLVPPAECGDEPYLLAINHPSSAIVVGRDRYGCGQVSEALFPRCVHLLDDGFQHLRLKRQINLLLLDAADPFRSNRLLPAGHLREPRSAMQRADLICITRSDQPFERENLVRLIRRHNAQAPILFSRMEAQGLVEAGKSDLHAINDYRGIPVAAFCGIARPHLFFAQLRELGLNLCWEKKFPDHHNYDCAELDRLQAESRQAGAGVWITTQKDEVKISRLGWKEMPLFFLRIGVGFEEESPLWSMLQERVG